MEAAVRASAKLREIFASSRIAVAPGAYDGLSARLVEQAGFPAVYASGGAIARSAGVPDLGLISMSTIVERLGPEIEDIMQVDISEQWRCHRSLTCPRIADCHDPVFKDARLQPFLDETDYARVIDPVL